MRQFPTSVENIAINLIYHWLEEDRYNRTYDEYMAIAKRVPTLDACDSYINAWLQKIHETGRAPYSIDYSTARRRAKEVPFPTSISRETIRTAIKVHFQLETIPRRSRKSA